MVNEVLLDLEGALSPPVVRDHKLAIIAAVGAAAFAVGAYLQGGRVAAGACVGAGVLAVAGCVWSRDQSLAAAKRGRAVVDAQVEELTGELYDAEIVLPRRRSRRFRGR